MKLHNKASPFLKQIVLLQILNKIKYKLLINKYKL